MMSGFSGVLKLTDLDDFITPSQECIKPYVNQETSGRRKGHIEIEDTEIPDRSEYKKAKITLTDCLACSGCITSAEAVLVSQQSLEELNKVIKNNNDTCNGDIKYTIVLSISTQSIISLAAKHSLTPQDCTEKLVGYFKSIGVDYVFDVNFARCFSLIESLKEFLQRFERKDSDPNALPMLASSCPGWVCYAEKTHGSYILPYISTVRSPQQIMGSLVKGFWADKVGISASKVYHVTLMPCFDKKLEASRMEFYSDLSGTRDVDCVITSVEVEEMLSNENINLQSVPSEKLDPYLSLSEELSTHEGSASGGFAHYIFTEAAKKLYGRDDELTWKTLRNNDFQEISLEVNGTKQLNFALAYGFRNIQNLVQKLKRKKSPYHFIEVMACPSGCLNGGAQVRPDDGKNTKDLVAQLEQMYKQLPKSTPTEDDRISSIYSEWLGGEEGTMVEEMFHTSYKSIESNINPLGIKW